MAQPFYTEFANATCTGNFASLSLKEACAIYGIFESLTEQLIAYSNQPRFGDAGLALLEDMSEDLGRQMRGLVAHIKSTAPMDRFERDARVKTLIRDAMLDTDDPNELASIATDFGRDRH